MNSLLASMGVTLKGQPQQAAATEPTTPVIVPAGDVKTPATEPTAPRDQNLPITLTPKKAGPIKTDTPKIDLEKRETTTPVIGNHEPEEIPPTPPVRDEVPAGTPPAGETTTIADGDRGGTKETTRGPDGKITKIVKKDKNGVQTNKWEYGFDNEGNKTILVYGKNTDKPEQQNFKGKDNRIAKTENYNPDGSIKTIENYTHTSETTSSNRITDPDGNILNFIPDISTPKGAMKFIKAQDGQLTMDKDDKKYVLKADIQHPQDILKNQEFLTNMENWQELTGG